MSEFEIVGGHRPPLQSLLRQDEFARPRIPPGPIRLPPEVVARDPWQIQVLRIVHTLRDVHVRPPTRPLIGKAHSPPCKGGVAAPLIKMPRSHRRRRRRGGRSHTIFQNAARDATCERPPRPRLFRNGNFFFMARPPLLCKEGNALTLRFVAVIAFKNSKEIC